MIAPHVRTAGRAAVLAALLASAAAPAAQQDTRLVEAARDGGPAEVRALLAQGVPGHAVEADGTTALHWAVRADDPDTVRALLRAGAMPAAANRYGVTPLALAAVNGSAAVTAMLLDAGADPNAASGEGETVLMAAARTGRPEPVRLLLARGADVHARERAFGETALMWAAGHDHPEVVRLLAAAGADLDARSTVIELPPAKVDLATMVTTALPKGGMTALMYAGRQGAAAAAVALADAGAALDLGDPDGTTALLFAIINVHFDVAARLVEKGADPNVGDSAGMAALYAAVDMANPDPLINRPRATPSGRLRAPDLVGVLLAHGADPNGRLKAPLLMRQHNGGDASLGNGATPLMRALKAGAIELTRRLLDGGADPSVAMQNRTTTLMVALGGRGARTLTPGVPVFQAIQLLLERGADVNATNAAGETLLHQGVARGEAFVRLLAAHGAKPDVRDKSGRTPLDVALGVPAAAPAGRGRGARGGGPPPARADDATLALLRELAKTAEAEPR